VNCNKKTGFCSIKWGDRSRYCSTVFSCICVTIKRLVWTYIIRIFVYKALMKFQTKARHTIVEVIHCNSESTFILLLLRFAHFRWIPFPVSRSSQSFHFRSLKSSSSITICSNCHQMTCLSCAFYSLFHVHFNTGSYFPFCAYLLGRPHTNCVKTSLKTWDKRNKSWCQHHDSDRCAAVFVISFVSTVLLSLRHVADIVPWLLHVLTHAGVRPTLQLIFFS
jgi:hypothetical protein